MTDKSSEELLCPIYLDKELSEMKDGLYENIKKLHRIVGHDGWENSYIEAMYALSNIHERLSELDYNIWKLRTDPGKDE
jgi:hypothetical protein